MKNFFFVLGCMLPGMILSHFVHNDRQLFEAFLISCLWGWHYKQIMQYLGFIKKDD